MKKVLLIVTFLFLIGSLFLVQRALAIPVEVKTQVTVLKYQHEGKFDYVAHLKPSFFYDSYQAQPSVPQIPVKFIDAFNMTFTFKSVEQTSRIVEVDALLENASSWQKKIVLIPAANQTGDFAIAFPVDLAYFSNLAQTIDTEIGTTSSSVYNISIEVIVSRPRTQAGQLEGDFTQAVPIKLGKFFAEIGSELTRRQGSSVGTFNYALRLKPNSLFEDVTLKPPVPPPSGKTALPGDTVFLRLVDVLDMNFSYYFKSDKPVQQSTATVEIDATVEVPKKWSKTIVLVPAARKTGDFTVAFPLDLNQFAELADIIQQETGITSAPYSLAITARVSSTVETDSGTIKEDFTQNIQTALNEGILSWGEMRLTKPGSILASKTIANPAKFLRLPLPRARTIFPVLAGIFLALFIFAVVLFFLPGNRRLTRIDRQAQLAEGKYKGLIIAVKELPAIKPGEAVVKLASLDDLMKTAEGLLKPVLHKAAGQSHIYCVLDAAIRYEYRLGREDADR